MLINCHRVASASDWRSPAPVDVTSRLKPGRNALAVEGENLASQVTANPAGLMACLEIELADGQKLVVQSDESWRSAQELSGEHSAWTAADFDDSPWRSVAKLAAYGAAPWGAFTQSATYGPYATGIEGKIRVIYIPESRPIEIRSLAPGATHTAFVFDPVSGKQIDLGKLSPNDQGLVVAAKPALESDAEDWVLVIRSE
ncbi:alpha-L-rhamnosidase N-terminal domain-containing protein [Lacipirellula sp.]|uniref:alpha-L-rhamnosidase N-terminal domain-containing protein n=1 Tax=Lacipirellula sp. TaxID=2691419 RepID=UPI003D0F5F2E